MKNILMGIGNPLRGDDGVGPYIADRFRLDGWESLNCETVPENFTSIIKNKKPDLLVMIDSAELGLHPGEFRIIPKSKIDQISLTMTTHDLPLNHLINYFENFAKKSVLIGIQPKTFKMVDELSNEVKKGADELMKVLEEGGLKKIKV